MKTRLAFVLIVLFMALAVFAFWIYNKPHLNANQPPFATFSAVEFYEAFLTDETTANKNYLNKVIEVYGEVVEVMKDLDFNTVVVFKSGDPVFGVRCTMETTVKVKPGDVVHIKGICKGFLTDVILINCILVKSRIIFSINGIN